MADRVKRRRLSRNSWRESTTDGVIQTDFAFQASEDKLYVHTHQPNKVEILRQNARDAKYSADHRDLRRGVRIPEEDFGYVCRRWPGLVRGTLEERQKALSELMRAHPEWIRIKYTKKIFGGYQCPENSARERRIIAPQSQKRAKPTAKGEQPQQMDKL
jgi:hypothetical protein